MPKTSPAPATELDAMVSPRRVLALIAILVIVALGASAVAITSLLTAAIDQSRAMLTEIARSQARLIEAVGAFDARYSTDFSEGPIAATLDQIRVAQANYTGFGQTGEFTLAYRDGDRIRFLLSHRHPSEQETSVAWRSALAEPMRLALSGQAITLIGTDYRGVRVLAASEPIAGLDWGLVAKVDLAELSRPFLRTAILVLAITLVLASLGAWLSLRLIRPVLRSLRESESRFRAVFTHAPLGIALVDEQGCPKLANLALQRILGYDAETLARTPFPAFTHPDDVDKDLGQYQALWRGESRSYSMEKRYLRPDGELVWGELTVSLISGADGHPLGAIGMVEDIGTRREMAHRLRQSAALEGALADLSTALLRAIDGALDGLIGQALAELGQRLAVDRCFVALMDAPRQRLTRAQAWCAAGIDCDPTGKPPLLVAQLPALMASLESGDLVNIPSVADLPPAWRAERDLMTGLGIRAVLAVPLVYDDDLIGLVGFERMHAEHVWHDDEIRAITLLGNLIGGAIGRERTTASLRANREELRTALEDLESAFEKALQMEKLSALGTFVAGIAHEIKNPLMGLSNYIDHVDAHTVDLALKEILADARHQVRRIGRIVDGVLGYAHGGMDRPEPVAIKDAVERACALLDSELVRHQIRLDRRIPDALPTLITDRGILEQALVNLLLNAIQAVCDRDRREIRIAAEDDGAWLKIAVSDTGPGVPPRLRNRIYDPFFTTKPPGQGTGLGLSVTLRQLSEIGAELELDQDYTGGARFLIRLPLRASS